MCPSRAQNLSEFLFNKNCFSQIKTKVRFGVIVKSQNSHSFIFAKCFEKFFVFIEN